MDSQGLTTVLMLILGITLIISGIGKTQNLRAFTQGVIAYQVLPTSLARWYSRLLPFVEIGAGAFLLMGIGARMVAMIALLMFVSFALAVTINLFRKRAIPCYCFSADASAKIGWHTLARILLLLLASVVIVVLPSVSLYPTLFRVQSINDAINFIPLILLTILGLITLALVEISPWLVNAWTASPIKTNRPNGTVIWARDPETPDEGGQK